MQMMHIFSGMLIKCSASAATPYHVTLLRVSLLTWHRMCENPAVMRVGGPGRSETGRISAKENGNASTLNRCDSAPLNRANQLCLGRTVYVSKVIPNNSTLTAVMSSSDDMSRYLTVGFTCYTPFCHT